MRLYLLTNHHYRNWDCYFGKVIAAIDEAQARRLANFSTGDEGSIWEDADKVTCSEIAAESIYNHACTVLDDFHAG